MHRGFGVVNETTALTALGVCARSRLLCVGEEVHCLVLKCGFERFELVGSVLVNFYSSCRRIREARRVFEELCEGNGMVWSALVVGYVQCNMLDEGVKVFMRMPFKDVHCWTSLISGYSKVEEGSEKALRLFKEVRDGGELWPNEFTLDCVLRACARLGVLRCGQGVHGLVLKCGFECDQSVVSALIEFYCSCQVFEDSGRVYEEVKHPSLDVSNSLIGGYVSMGRIEDAEIIFNRMPKRNSVSYNLMIKGYAKCGRPDVSEKLFEQMPQKTIVSFNTMISVYSDIGEIDRAREIFEIARGRRNSVTWNSMISGHILNGQHQEAIKVYQEMHILSIEKTMSTFSSIFSACSSLGSLQQGMMIHGHLIKTLLDSDVYVGTSLVDMYARCGSISDAKVSFDCITLPNVAAWTALINGYSHHGLGSKAYVLFQQMLEHGVAPNGTTFVGLLSACARAGMVDEGMKIFHSMENRYGVTPNLEHYACVVDLLGRAGHLLEAQQFVKKLPIEADSVIWGALLNACWFWMDMDAGQKVADKLFTLDPKSTFSYVIMSNMYARVGRWQEKMRSRKNLTRLEVKKDPGCSWIELNNTVHTFAVQDKLHPHCHVVYETLCHLSKHVSSIGCLLKDASTPIREPNENVVSFFDC